MKWTAGQGKNKNQWLQTGGDGRIKQADPNRYLCWRGNRYLGTEPTFKQAEARVQANKISDRSLKMTEWERGGAKGNPPFKLTANELAEHRRRYPNTGKGPPPDPAKAPKRAALAGVAPLLAKRASDVPSTGTIRVKPGATVPKRPGSPAHARWTALWGYDGQPVATYAKAGGNMTTLANAMLSGHVTIEE